MNPDSLDALLDMLRSDDTQRRQQAAIEIGRMQDERIVPALREALHDPDATVRANAAAGLGINKVTDASQELINLLKDDVDIVRERAATALAQIGDGNAIPALIDAIDDSGVWARNRIMYVLGASKDARAVEPLIVQLDAEDPSTQGVAAWALGTIGDPRALEPLTDLLNDPTASVRGNVAMALSEMGGAEQIDALRPLLADESPEVRGKTCWALGTLGEETGETRIVADLLPLLDDYAEVPSSSHHLFVSQYAAEALTQIGTEEALQAVEAWKPVARERLLPHRIADALRALRHRDLETRERALNELVEIGPVAIPQIRETLQTSNDARIRQGCAQALGMLGVGESALPLMMALGDPDVGVWSQAVAALARLGTAAEKQLRPALSREKGRVKQGAALALWRISGEERAFRIVLQALQDEELVVRGSAITSLWQRPDERAVATLQIQLNAEDDAMMQKYILQALQTIGGPTATATVANYLAENADRLRRNNP